MDRGAWRATVHGVAQSRTRLKRLNTHTPLSSNPLRTLPENQLVYTNAVSVQWLLHAKFFAWENLKNCLHTSGLLKQGQNFPVTTGAA